MELTKKDVILMSFADIISRPDGGGSFNRRLLIRALDMTEGSFRVYMSKLYRDGLLERKGDASGKGIARKVRLTPAGQTRVKECFSALKDVHLECHVHKADPKVRLLDIYYEQEDPYRRALLLSKSIKDTNFDLDNLLGGLDSYCEVRRVNECSDAVETLSCRTFVDMLLKTTILGSRCLSGWSDGAELLLRQADAAVYQGRFLEAEKIIDILISEGDKVSADILYIARLAQFEVRLKTGQYDMAKKTMSELEGSSTLLVHIGLVHMDRGRYNRAIGSFEPALKELTTAANIFKDLRSHHLLSLALRHRGNTYLTMGRTAPASSDLKASLKSARLSGNVCLEAWALNDLAGYLLMTDRRGQAVRCLKKAEKLCWELGDTEGLSWVESRWAWYFNLNGEQEEAKAHLYLALNVNYPRPLENERKLMFGSLGMGPGPK